MQIKIGSKIISSGGKPYFIADIAANHDGSLERAFKLIELAKEAGADVAKFQNFKANKIVSKVGFDSMPKKSHQSGWKKSVYEVYEEASLCNEWTEKLKEKCDEVGIEYMTSPYDFESVDHADNYVNAFKIGSGDITWTEMLSYIAHKNKPILLATGASNISDVDRAVNTITKINSNLILMQCNTNYTANHENYKYINLNVLKSYSEKYPNCILGLSDHTYGHTTVLGAIALGARVIEKHFTDDNNRIGPDHKFSMNPTTWKDMVAASNDLWHSLGDGIKRVEDNEKESLIVQQRGIYIAKNITKGQVICYEDLISLRPLKNDGIPPYYVDKIIGKRAGNNLDTDSYLKWEDIDND